jgi:hypothetical protein
MKLEREVLDLMLAEVANELINNEDNFDIDNCPTFRANFEIMVMSGVVGIDNNHQLKQTFVTFITAALQSSEKIKSKIFAEWKDEPISSGVPAQFRRGGRVAQSRHVSDVKPIGMLAAQGAFKNQAKRDAALAQRIESLVTAFVTRGLMPAIEAHAARFPAPAV